MNRRHFLFGLVGLAGAGAAASLIASPVEASVLGQLRNIDASTGGVDDTLPTQDIAGTTPDGTPVESVQHWHRPPPPRHHRRRRKRRVCRRTRDRWGRTVRRCRYVWY